MRERAPAHPCRRIPGALDVRPAPIPYTRVASQLFFLSVRNIISSKESGAASSGAVSYTHLASWPSIAHCASLRMFATPLLRASAVRKAHLRCARRSSEPLACFPGFFDGLKPICAYASRPLLFEIERNGKLFARFFYQRLF